MSIIRSFLQGGYIYMCDYLECDFSREIQNTVILLWDQIDKRTEYKDIKSLLLFWRYVSQLRTCKKIVSMKFLSLHTVWCYSRKVQSSSTKIVLINLKTFKNIFWLKFKYFMLLMIASHQEVMVCFESVLFIFR